MFSSEMFVLLNSLLLWFDHLLSTYVHMETPHFPIKTSLIESQNQNGQANKSRIFRSSYH